MRDNNRGWYGQGGEKGSVIEMHWGQQWYPTGNEWGQGHDWGQGHEKRRQAEQRE